MHLGDGAEGEMMPMMQQMMQNLLSKDILYPSLKEVVEKVSVGQLSPWLGNSNHNYDTAAVSPLDLGSFHLIERTMHPQWRTVVTFLPLASAC